MDSTIRLAKEPDAGLGWSEISPLGKENEKGIWEKGFTDGMALIRDTRLISISLWSPPPFFFSLLLLLPSPRRMATF